MGWVKVHRQLSTHEIWLSESFTRGQAWVDLIMIANHKPGFIRVRGIKVEVARGQVGYSERSLAKRWKWSRGKVQRFLKELSKKAVQQIEPQKNNVTTLITIVNYEQYQGDGPQNGPQTGPQTGHRRDQNKNDKKDKNVKKKIYKRKKAHTQAPVEYPITEAMEKYAAQKGYVADLEKLTENFLLYHREHGNTRADWHASWQRWMRNQLEWHPECNVAPGNGGKPNTCIEPKTYAQAQDAEGRQQVELLKALRQKRKGGGSGSKLLVGKID